MALIDAWAVAADVLTFYTERIANENYLGTATERRSVAGTDGPDRLSARRGRGGPDDRSPSPSPPHRDRRRWCRSPWRRRCRRLPGPGELPQTFETVEDLRRPAGVERATGPADRAAAAAGRRHDACCSPGRPPTSAAGTPCCSLAENATRPAAGTAGLGHLGRGRTRLTARTAVTFAPRSPDALGDALSVTMLRHAAAGRAVRLQRREPDAVRARREDRSRNPAERRRQ